MPILSQSLEVWLLKNHFAKLLLIRWGHVELFTAEMNREYLQWCLTDEGRQYLVGGSKYDPKHKGNIASAKAHQED